MSDFVIAQIRTYVPMAVGAFLAWVAVYGFNLVEIESELVTVLTFVLSAIYYFLVRWAAEKWPSVGVLLGVNKAPEYQK